ncbi:MAG: tol-pal system protein YbgF [Methylophilaceae bacterium]|jgi:tol-pal system protein YbgF|nr:tol-pal system protein YbgF [Methylophilaceae bacterium]
MKKYFWVGLLFVAHSAFAIFEDEEARKKLNSIQDQLDNIQSNIDYKVSQALKNQNLVKFQNELNGILDQIRTLNGEIEVLQFQSKNSEERQKILYQEINERLTGLELKIESLPKEEKRESLPEVLKGQEENTINPDVPQESINKEIARDVDQQKIDPENINVVDENISPEEIDIVDENLPLLVDKNIEIDEFSEAKALLRATKYKEAFAAFDKFVINYPNSELIAEAKYNLGYSQFTLKNYKAAIKTYTKISKLHPESSILPEALYGIANCQIQLTRITKAKKTLRNLIKKFPNAEIIPSAKKRLKALESIKL